MILFYLLILTFSFMGQDKPDEKQCSDCHHAILLEKSKHTPVEKDCNTCHKANGNEHPGKEKGFSLIRDVPALCYTCHDARNTKKDVHPPIKNGKCMLCHSQHSSQNSAMLLLSPVSTLCMECHDLEMTDKKSKHKAVTNGNCMDCHDPHESDFKNLIKKDRPVICLNCHTREAGQGKMTVVHPPFSRNCLLCHNGHSSDQDHLVSQPLTDLCSGCHDSELQDTEITTTATGFRNGEKNLHYLHLHESKVRTCTSCHNVHASMNLHLIADKVRFGSWDMPLRYESREDGGSCSPGCHGLKEYKR
jgi:predicted CXXCH cytochrome family protein